MESEVSVEILAERVRAGIDRPVVAERMFGGITFMLDGNRLCCVSAKGLMVRVGAEAEPEALERPFVARCLGAGRPMAGFLLVEPRGVSEDADLAAWLARVLAYVGSLPPKNAKPRRARRHSPRRKPEDVRRAS
jgi:hypothetical protein